MNAPDKKKLPFLVICPGRLEIYFRNRANAITYIRIKKSMPGNEKAVYRIIFQGDDK